jgi:putative transposase
MIYSFIHNQSKDFRVRRLCENLEVSSSGYYAWRSRPLSTRDRRRAELAERIRSIHDDNRNVYGSPKIYQALLLEGQKVCRNTVAGLMKTLGIASITHKPLRARTTDSDHSDPVAPNILDRKFDVKEINKVWTTDITYIPTAEGFLYLAGVMDLCSRRIVGWSMGETRDAALTCEALKMALARRHPPAGLLHHSDRGSQYTCDAYRVLLQEHGARASMSRTGDCYDNAPTESLWGKLKTEMVHHHRFKTRDEARRAVFDYIEAFYNRRRLHSSLGYLSPEQFEARLT